MSIRSKLLLMLAIPLVALALVGVLGFRTQSSSAQVAADSLDDDAVVQSINTAVKAIGAERLAFAEGVANRGELRFATDQSLVEVLSLARSTNNAAILEDVVADATSSVNAARLTRVFATSIDEFNEATEVLRDIRSEVPISYPDQVTFAEAGSVNLAVDIADRQDVVWLDYLAADTVTEELVTRIQSEATSVDVLRQEILNLAPDTHSADLNETLAGETDVAIRQASRFAVTRFDGNQPPISDVNVLEFLAESHDEWHFHGETLQEDVQDNLGDIAQTAESRQNLFALLGILGLLILLGLIYVVYHSVVTPLNDLLRGAESVANDRLPTVVSELRTMGSSDSAVRLEPLPRTSDDELGTLVDAFNDVQLTAFDLAVEQAKSRRNIAEMFVNLGRRNQKLLQRMLSVISELEHDEKNADKLERLFDLDHMTTRMRRNAESLLVVAGTTTPRQWAKPVPAADVVRSALAEVQDYHRIDLLTLAEAPMAGNAAADVTHLMAELLENSLQFSEPESRVSVSSRWHDGNYRIVITDQGFGMTDQEMADNNALIANPPPPDQAPTRFLGLFVVGHLAKRHGIRVQLTDATIGGTDARITIPASLMSESAPSELDLTSGELPTRDDAGAPAAHLDLDAELAALTAETELLDPAPSGSVVPPADDDLFPAPASPAPVEANAAPPAPAAPAPEAPAPAAPETVAASDIETFSGAPGELPVRGDVDVFAEAKTEAPAVAPQSETFASATAPVAPPAQPEANTFATATGDLPVRGEANIDFGEIPQLPTLEKLPPRPPSSIGALPTRTEAPAPVAAPPAADLAAMGLPQRTPRATLQSIDGPTMTAPEPAAPAPVAQASGPEDLTSAAANVGSMFSAFQAGVQRGEESTN